MQTADREEKELRDLEVVKGSLWGSCSPSGQMTLAAEVGHLHELRASSVEALQERLRECEVRLRELDEQLASRVQALRGETSSLQRALQEQSEHLAYRGQLADLIQVQQHWQCLKVCCGCSITHSLGISRRVSVSHIHSHIGFIRHALFVILFNY